MLITMVKRSLFNVIQKGLLTTELIHTLNCTIFFTNVEIVGIVIQNFMKCFEKSGTSGKCSNYIWNISENFKLKIASKINL